MKHRLFIIQSLIFALIMSAVMSFCMSGVVTYINVGEFSPHFFSIWLKKAFPASYLIALPISIFIVPFIRMFTTWIMRKLFKDDYPSA